MKVNYLVVFPRPDLDLTGQTYDDAFCPERDCSGVSLPFKCAIADGAKITRSAGDWARLLVATFVNSSWDPGCIRNTWKEQEQHPMPRVAFAAFVGVVFEETTASTGNWHALAIGDSCLAQFRNNRFLNSFPIEPSYDFKRSPSLVASTTPINDHHVQKISGTFNSGDTFVLMTDGFGKLFLPGFQNGRYLTELLTLEPPDLCRWTLRFCLEHRAKSSSKYDASLIKVSID